MKNLFCFLMAFSMSTLANAETLTIEQCVNLSRENYPAIAQYSLIDKTAEYNLSNASKGWLPQGSVSGQLTWQNDVASWPDQLAAMLAQQGVSFSGMNKTQYRLGFDVNQQIWDGGKISATRHEIEAASDVERRSLDVQLYDIEGRVQDIYFGVLALDAKIQNVDKSMVLVDSTLQQVKSMFRNGVAMQSDCDQIEARLLTLQQQRSQLVEMKGGYNRVLEIFIGQPIGNRALVLPDITPNNTVKRPQMQLFDAQLNSISTQEYRVKASTMPQIGAFASGYYGYPGYNMFKNMQNHDPSFNFMIGLRVSWNFGSLYTRSNSLNKLQLQREQIETNRKTFIFNNSLAETEKESQITSMKEVIKNDEKIVALRRSVIRAAQSQLRNGVIDTNSLLSKITDMELAENDRTLHNIELTKSIYNLNHIQNK